MPLFQKIHWNHIFKMFKLQYVPEYALERLKDGRPEGCFNHYKDKMVSQLYYLYNGNPHSSKDHLYSEIVPCSCWSHVWKGFFFGIIYFIRDHFVYMPSQWETTLHCNIVSLAGRIYKMIPALCEESYRINHQWTCQNRARIRPILSASVTFWPFYDLFWHVYLSSLI